MRSSASKLSPVLIALVALTLAPLDAGAVGHSHVRDGWMYGVNMGWGWARAEYDVTSSGLTETTQTPWVTDFHGGLRVAFAGSEKLAYGLDFSGWSERAGELKETIFWMLAQLNWFPLEQGLFVRGGAGLGTLNATVTAPLFVSQTKGGFGWNLGAGYEVRVSPTLAIGVAYDYRSLYVGEVASLDKVQTNLHGATFQLTWYPD